MTKLNVKKSSQLKAEYFGEKGQKLELLLHKIQNNVEMKITSNTFQTRFIQNTTVRID